MNKQKKLIISCISCGSLGMLASFIGSSSLDIHTISKLSLIAVFNVIQIIMLTNDRKQ